jgi:hypothetical protein
VTRFESTKIVLTLPAGAVLAGASDGAALVGAAAGDDDVTAGEGSISTGPLCTVDEQPTQSAKSAGRRFLNILQDTRSSARMRELRVLFCTAFLLMLGFGVGRSNSIAACVAINILE